MKSKKKKKERGNISYVKLNSDNVCPLKLTILFYYILYNFLRDTYRVCVSRHDAKFPARSAQHPRYRITRETLTDKRQRTQTRGRGKLHRNWSGWEMEECMLAGCGERRRRRIKVGSRNKQVVGVE